MERRKYLPSLLPISESQKLGAQGRCTWTYFSSPTSEPKRDELIRILIISIIVVDAEYVDRKMGSSGKESSVCEAKVFDHLAECRDWCKMLEN